MKIIKPEKYIVRFGDLSGSVCFDYNGKIYMKISNMSLKFHAVDLEYGYLEEFDKDTEVAIIEIECKSIDIYKRTND